MFLRFSSSLATVRIFSGGIAGLTLLALTACEKAHAPSSTEQENTQPLHVESVNAERSTAPFETHLTGRLEAFRTAEVRARVAGILQQRVYAEGQEVDAGQLLFRIDPAPLQAALDAAAANLALTRAVADAAQDTARRSQRLVAQESISEQKYRQDHFAQLQAEAQVRLAAAQLRSARLNLDYAHVTAPIAGRARRALVSEGALVSAEEGTPLTRIEQLDPLYVNFSQPLREAMALQQALGDGATEGVQVRIRLADGTLYPQPATLLFADRAVDAATDTVAMRASLPNPEQRLLPGMYVDVLLAAPNARPVILVPQAALNRSASGAYVMVVIDGLAQRRAVVATGLENGRWRIDAGLQGGEQVLLHSAGIRPGQAVVVSSPLGQTSSVAGG